MILHEASCEIVSPTLDFNGVPVWLFWAYSLELDFVRGAWGVMAERKIRVLVCERIEGYFKKFNKSSRHVQYIIK